MIPNLDDLTEVTVEHLLGVATGTARPLVKLRAVSGSAVLLGEIDPADARNLAADLMAAAARAEYELDLYRACTDRGFEPEVLVGILELVRDGEQKREEGR